MLVDLDIHILALNETKLDSMYPKELTNIPGYQHVRHDRSCRGGGITEETFVMDQSADLFTKNN